MARKKLGYLGVCQESAGPNGYRTKMVMKVAGCPCSQAHPVNQPAIWQDKAHTYSLMFSLPNSLILDANHSLSSPPVVASQPEISDSFPD